MNTEMKTTHKTTLWAWLLLAVLCCASPKATARKARTFSRPNLMEQAANKVDGVKYATINFMMQEMKVEFERDADQQSVMEQVRAVCKKIEDDCEVYI